MKRFVIILITCALLCSCNKENAVVGTDIPYNPELLNSATKSSLVSGSNLFSYKLLHSLLEQLGEKDTESLLISPLSCAMELAAWTESGNIDNEKILSMLGFSEGGREELRDYCHSVMYDIPSLSQTTKCIMGNLLVVDSDQTETTKEFQSNAAKYYDTEVASLPFNKPDNVVQYINSWAEKKTNGIIDGVVFKRDVENAAVYILSNVLYFNGAWTYPFYKNNTSKSDFTLENGKTTSVKMMKRNDFESDVKFPFGIGPCYSRLSLPYGNQAFHMDIFLPEEGYTVLDVTEYLAKNGRNEGYFSMTHPLEIQIPKFNIKNSLPLNDALNTLGGDAFAKTPFTISQIASMTIDENGTEAAAVTIQGMVGSPRPQPEPEPIRFIADHPFVFTISAGGIVLFAGVYKGD